MADQLQLSLFGLAGFISTIIVDRASTAQAVKDAMVDQCGLPGWQYQLVDGENELISLESLVMSDPEPGTSLPSARVPMIFICLNLEGLDLMKCLGVWV